MSLRVLLVESEPEAALFVQEVLSDMQDDQYWGAWVEIETLHAQTWADAATILAHERVDIVLLNLNLEDSHGADTFHQAAALAPDCPIVLLVKHTDTDVALRLVRDGAQDYLIVKDLDCGPLAHTMRNAMERNRLVSSIRSTSMVDSLTGLMNRSAFLALGDRDRKLAERLGRRLMVMVAAPAGLPRTSALPGQHHGTQRNDLILVETADHLRTLIGPTDLVARIGEASFGIAIFDTDVETLEGAWARIHKNAAEHRLMIGAAIFDGAHPATLETLLAQAVQDLPSKSLAVRT